VDAANVDAITAYGPNRTTATNGDNVNITFELEDSSGNYVEIASIRAIANDVTTTATDSGIQLFGNAGGTQTEFARCVTTTAGQATVVINEGSNDIDFRVETDNLTSAFFCNGAGDSCTFGSNTELGLVGIDGQADEIQLTIQAVSGQTANIFVIEDSSGNDLFAIAADGSITTGVGSGVPTQVANVALTAQSSTIGATSLYSPSTDTMVMVEAYAIVTQAATSSSTLGSIGLEYTDADNTTTQTTTMRCNNRTGSSVTQITGNSLTTVLNCHGTYRISGGTSMTYNMGYASSGATSMQYSLYIKVYKL